MCSCSLSIFGPIDSRHVGVVGHASQLDAYAVAKVVLPPLLVNGDDCRVGHALPITRQIGLHSGHRRCDDRIKVERAVARRLDPRLVLYPPLNLLQLTSEPR